MIDRVLRLILCRSGRSADGGLRPSEAVALTENPAIPRAHTRQSVCVDNDNQGTDIHIFRNRYCDSPQFWNHRPGPSAFDEFAQRARLRVGCGVGQL